MPARAATGSGAARTREVEAPLRRELAPPAEFLARVEKSREQLVARTTELAKENSLPLVRAVVAGSAARGTFLATRLDIDLFLLFPPELPREELERHGLALGRLLFGPAETRYAEHPYLRGHFEGFSVDAVPGYAVNDPSKPQSAVDRTPFHNEYLRHHQTPEMVEEVRLTKQFLWAQGIYGSESRTQGLSGYAVELLILKFATLDRLLEEARRWRPPVRITFAADSAPRVPEEVSLVIDDPVDPHRNVSSALSRRNLALLILAAEAYLAEPSERFFRPREPARVELAEALRRLAERGTHVTVLELPRPPLVDDILYPQLAKACRSIAEEAARLGFSVVGTASAAGDRTLTFLVETAEESLPAVRRQEGPPAGVARVDSFLAKWTAPQSGALQGPFVAEDGRLVVEAPRRARRVEAALTAALEHLSLGRDLVRELPAGSAFRALKSVTASPELPLALGELLEKRLPWLRS